MQDLLLALSADGGGLFDESRRASLTPAAIVGLLDQHIVGQVGAGVWREGEACGRRGRVAGRKYASKQHAPGRHAVEPRVCDVCGSVG